MKHKPYLDARFFFSTSPLPCPYLPGRMERRVVTELIGRNAPEMHDKLSEGGFRRSHSIAYAPACPSCDACTAVRVLAQEFRPSRSQRRIWARNADLTVEEAPAVATHEQYALFSRYQRNRHGGGDMSRMDFFDYQALIEDTPVETTVVEFRDADGMLVSACLTDLMETGLSAVYSFFDPHQNDRSLGSHMILWLIERTRQLGLEHVYLGFWIPDCSKMAYKTRFTPIEAKRPDGWHRHDQAPA
ncbi:MAG: arginyltransferase [Rhodospirillaceae bacterium]